MIGASAPRWPARLLFGRGASVRWPVVPGLALLAHALVWLAFLDWTSLVPPVDNIEQLTWVRSLEWGYYKHPPLPTWLFWPAVQLFGATARTSYAMGALCTLLGVALLWRLLRRLRGPAEADLALLAVLCITFYNYRLHYYNHNVVLMPLVVASALLAERAFATARRRWWLALGAVLGLGLLTKYQMALAVLALLLHWLQRRAWRDARQRQGLLLAALVALAIFAPHLHWLAAHGFAPIDYAMHSSLGVQLGPGARGLATLRWLADQLLNRALPAWLLLAVVARAWRPVVPGPPATAADAGRALLLVWGTLPLAAMVLLGLLTGADLQLHWGTPFLPLAVPAVMGLLRRDWAAPGVWRRAVPAFLGLQALLMAISLASSPLGLRAWSDRHWRHLDAPAMAGSVAEAARGLLAGPVRVISGPAALAGALALQLPERPLVLIDGRHDRSPWVPPGLVERCGLLELGDEGLLPDGWPVGPMAPGLYWRVRFGRQESERCAD